MIYIKELLEDSCGYGSLLFLKTQMGEENGARKATFLDKIVH